MEMIGDMMNLLNIHGEEEDIVVIEDIAMDWREEQEHKYLEDWMLELGIEGEGWRIWWWKSIP